MAKYNVRITRNIQETAWFEVEADDKAGVEAAAREIAERIKGAAEPDPSIKWERMQLDEDDEDDVEDEAA